jgi:hypothetical protein
LMIFCLNKTTQRTAILCMSSKGQFFGIKNRSCFYKLAKAHAIVSPLILASF